MLISFVVKDVKQKRMNGVKRRDVMIKAELIFGTNWFLFLLTFMQNMPCSWYLPRGPLSIKLVTKWIYVYRHLTSTSMDNWYLAYPNIDCLNYKMFISIDFLNINIFYKYLSRAKITDILHIQILIVLISKYLNVLIV